MSTLLYLFWSLWPWFIGIIDIISWVTTGSTLSPIPWEQTRGIVAACWPVFWIAIPNVFGEGL